MLSGFLQEFFMIYSVISNIYLCAALACQAVFCFCSCHFYHLLQSILAICSALGPSVAFPVDVTNIDDFEAAIHATVSTNNSTLLMLCLRWLNLEICPALFTMQPLIGDALR